MDFNSYDKHYVILTADRLLFNSKEDSIYLMSNKTIGLSARESIHFNVGPSGEGDPSKHEFIVNSPRIQLGMPDKGKNEPIAKADSTIECLRLIQKSLLKFSGSVTSSGASKPGILIAVNKLKIDLLKVEKYISKKSPIKSSISNTI